MSVVLCFIFHGTTIIMQFIVYPSFCTILSISCSPDLTLSIFRYTHSGIVMGGSIDCCSCYLITSLGNHDQTCRCRLNPLTSWVQDKGYLLTTASLDLGNVRGLYTTIPYIAFSYQMYGIPVHDRLFPLNAKSDQGFPGFSYLLCCLASSENLRGNLGSSPDSSIVHLVPRHLSWLSLLYWISSVRILLKCAFKVPSSYAFIPNSSRWYSHCYSLLLCRSIKNPINSPQWHQFQPDPKNMSPRRKRTWNPSILRNKSWHIALLAMSPMCMVLTRHIRKESCVFSLHFNVINKPTLMFGPVDALTSASSQFLESCIPYHLLIGPTLVLHL